MQEHLTLPRSEFAARCAAVQDQARKRDLAAVLVWSRGGGPVDGGSDVLYLTDHYTLFPTIPDLPGAWAGRGYAAALVTQAGGVWLCSDVLEVTEEDVFCTHLLHVSDLVAEMAEVIRAAGLGRGRVGLVGGGVMTRAQDEDLRTELPDVIWEPADDIVRRMRLRKSAAEQVLIREACAAGSEALDAMLAAVAAGRTEAEVVSAGVAAAVTSGVALYNAFADTYGPSWKDRGRHRMPTYSSTQRLQDGDIFTIDMSGAVKGYLFDFSRSAIAGDTRHRDGQRLIDVAREAVRAVVDALRPGATVGAAVRAGQEVLDRAGFSGSSSDFAAFGHGLGLGWEEPWLLPDDETTVQPGMYLAVEKVLTDGNLGASYEDDVLITDDGPEILTRVRQDPECRPAGGPGRLGDGSDGPPKPAGPRRFEAG